jgi:hypothetical protein
MSVRAGGHVISALIRHYSLVSLKPLFAAAQVLTHSHQSSLWATCHVDFVSRRVTRTDFPLLAAIGVSKMRDGLGM